MKLVLNKLILTCLIVCCISADKVAEKILISEVHFSGGLYIHKEKPVTGAIIDYYENNILKFTYAALDGRLHGKATEFFEDGDVKSIRNYKVNKLFGDFTEFYANGEVKVQFEVGLNAYGQGEKLTNIKISKGPGKKLKSYEEGTLIFLDANQNALQTSEQISILKQSKFRIVDDNGSVIYEQ